MTPAEMEAEAQLSEIRVEALQQLTSALSGSRISLPHDDGAPSQLLWHSPTYGAGQQLLPTGIPANTLPPTAGVNHGRSLATPEPAYVGMNAPEQRRAQFGQESFHAFHRDQPDRRTVFDLRARTSTPGSYDQQHMPRDSVIQGLDEYRAFEAASITSAISRQWDIVTHLSRKVQSFSGIRRQQRPMLATVNRVSGCAIIIRNQTEVSLGVSAMEALSTKC